MSVFKLLKELNWFFTGRMFKGVKIYSPIKQDNKLGSLIEEEKMCDNKFDVKHYNIMGTSITQTVICGWFKSNGSKYKCKECQSKGQFSEVDNEKN